MLAYLPIGGASSLGGLRVRSLRFFDTACSLNDDDVFAFESRRLLEKLPAVDLLTLRLNIFGRFRKVGSFVIRQRGPDQFIRGSRESVVEMVDFGRNGCLAMKRKRKERRFRREESNIYSSQAMGASQAKSRSEHGFY